MVPNGWVSVVGSFRLTLVNVREKAHHYVAAPGSLINLHGINWFSSGNGQDPTSIQPHGEWKTQIQWCSTIQVIQVNLWSPSWRSLSRWKGHVFTIPKRSQRIARMIMMFIFIEVLHKKSLLNPVVMPVQQFTVATLLFVCLKNTMILSWS